MSVIATEELKDQTARGLAQALTHAAETGVLGLELPKVWPAGVTAWAVAPLTEGERDHPRDAGRRLLTVQDGIAVRNGPSLRLTWPEVWGSKTLRLVVRGQWPSEIKADGSAGTVVTPSDCSGGIRRAGLTNEISVDAGRPVGQIAGEIRRRLLPDYVGAWQACHEVVESRAAYARLTEETVQILLRDVGGKRHGQTATAVWPDGESYYHAAVTAQGTDVHLESFTVPRPLAVVVLRLVRQWWEEAEGEKVEPAAEMAAETEIR